MEDLNCINCKTSVSSDQAAFFDGVFLCKTCELMAQRFYDRGRRELNQLMAVFKEAVRIALITGKLHFGSDPDVDVSKTDLLRTIMKLEEERERSKKA